ncbi:nucleotidyltransferase family protein [Frigidibacter oleivorans]|uniref:nucleotidyltransferase family protein n=1 Tax=Frigidibacter oleivorans TaxID=2487129 RepID=UPI000F8EBF97|nr:nucleotidyltransferase family protein [Frigidibacter oleivorans]
MTIPLALICAAGSSSRMRGSDKLIQQVDGVPVLRHAAAAARAAGMLVAVALPAAGPFRAGRLAALQGLELTALPVPEAAEGIAASIRAGAAAAEAAPGIMVLLADMPEIGAEDLAAVLAGWSGDPDRVARATAADGRPGHPVLFPRRLFPRLATLTGDAGARGVLAGEDVLPVPLPGSRALTDLDTPEDWAAWRARSGR